MTAVVNSYTKNFNSIKVRLKPIVLNMYISENTIGLRVQRYKKCFEKMSMWDNIFYAVLRQLPYFKGFQYVKEQFWSNITL